MKLTLNREFGLYQGGNKVFCDSLQVAETFEKRHDNVLRDIENITAPNSGLSEEFTALNFEVSSYKDKSGKSNPKYYLTKDGFTILTFGYSGQKAMAFKEAYITRFNQMEQFIKTLATTRAEFPEFTSAIKQAHKTPHSKECLFLFGVKKRAAYCVSMPLSIKFLYHLETQSNMNKQHQVLKL